MAVERLAVLRLAVERFAVLRFAVERLAVERFAVERFDVERDVVLFLVAMCYSPPRSLAARKSVLDFAVEAQSPSRGPHTSG